MKKEIIKTTPFSFIYMILGVMLLVAAPAWSGGLNAPITLTELRKAKAFFDDPRPVYKNLDWKKFIPKEEAEKYLTDVEASKVAWAEVLGFKSPDLVGKIAPEIKPGIYNYKDKDQHPGIKELMIPHQYEMFAPGAPPYPGNFQQIEIIPTRQYYEPLAYSELTNKHLGKTKQDDQGYVLWKTYEGGLPWPKPSGPHKAMQIVYNQQYAPQTSDNVFMITENKGFTKDLKIDSEYDMMGGQLKTHGRFQSPPLGWYDERAEKMGELRTRGATFLAPRSAYGQAIGGTQYLDPLNWDSNLLYLPGFRRVRKMSATDTQDIQPGFDNTTDDTMGFQAKMSPDIYPYEYKVLAEREYLVQAHDIDGAWYLTSPEKGCERVNTKWERRPMYVVELTQLDKSYVYGKRILYIDKETFMIHSSLKYDQQGKLFRSSDFVNQFIPEAGIVNANVWDLQKDHIDTHSRIVRSFVIPDPRVGREVGNIKDLMGTK